MNEQNFNDYTHFLKLFYLQVTKKHTNTINLNQKLSQLINDISIAYQKSLKFETFNRKRSQRSIRYSNKSSSKSSKAIKSLNHIKSQKNINKQNIITNLQNNTNINIYHKQQSNINNNKQSNTNTNNNTNNNHNNKTLKNNSQNKQKKYKKIVHFQQQPILQQQTINQ